MRNVVPTGNGVCLTCHTFIDPAYSRCYSCNGTPDELDVVVPITYSEHLGQMHTALRNYKDGGTTSQHYALPRLASILWLFLETHEVCVALAAGVERRFELVTTVPSSQPARDDARDNLRWIVKDGCEPTQDRFERVLRATGNVAAGRHYDADRYVATRPLDGKDVLLVDDTWATGGHAQSAAAALTAAGARRVGLVVIGRHIQRGWEPEPGVTNGQKLDALPKAFDWDTCCVHS